LEIKTFQRVAVACEIPLLSVSRSTIRMAPCSPSWALWCNRQILRQTPLLLTSFGLWKCFLYITLYRHTLIRSRCILSFI